jgi:hypothetical protein
MDGAPLLNASGMFVGGHGEQAYVRRDRRMDGHTPA